MRRFEGDVCSLGHPPAPRPEPSLSSSPAGLTGGSSRKETHAPAPGLLSPSHGFAGQAGERRDWGESPPVRAPYRPPPRTVHRHPPALFFSSPAGLTGGSSRRWSPSRAPGLPSPPPGFAGQASERRERKASTANARSLSASAGPFFRRLPQDVRVSPPAGGVCGSPGRARQRAPAGAVPGRGLTSPRAWSAFRPSCWRGCGGPGSCPPSAASRAATRIPPRAEAS